MRENGSQRVCGRDRRRRRQSWAILNKYGRKKEKTVCVWEEYGSGGSSRGRSPLPRLAWKSLFTHSKAVSNSWQITIPPNGRRKWVSGRVNKNEREIQTRTSANRCAQYLQTSTTATTRNRMGEKLLAQKMLLYQRHREYNTEDNTQEDTKHKTNNTAISSQISTQPGPSQFPALWFAVPIKANQPEVSRECVVEDDLIRSYWRLVLLLSNRKKRVNSSSSSNSTVSFPTEVQCREDWKCSEVNRGDNFISRPEPTAEAAAAAV